VLYLKGLVNFYEIMSKSTNYLRMARSLKLLVLKAYLSTAKPEKLTLSEDFLKHFSLSSVDIPTYVSNIVEKA